MEKVAGDDPPDGLHEQVTKEVRDSRRADHRIAPAFLNRWSPRAFSPEPVDDETLLSVFEAARWAASSYNEQPWRFLVAREAEDRQRFLGFLAPSNQVWAKHAPVLLLVISKRTFTHNDEPNKTYQFDAGAASGYLTLQTSLNGLYAHGMVGFDADHARTALGIPADFDPLAAFAIGKRGDVNSLPDNLREREKPSGRRPVAESIMEGRFRNAVEEKAESDTMNDTDGSLNFRTT